MAYRTLDAAEIVATLQTLERRITERFPGSGLSKVNRELVALAGETQRRAERVAAPDLVLRIAIYAAIVVGIAGLVLVGLRLRIQVGSLEVFGFFQGLEAAINIMVIAGAALFFAITAEVRVKRGRALRALHEIRSIAHVIDMHQLTKDPSFVLDSASSTPSSPERGMSRFELTRYLDYCSEMLALAGKLAALFAQSLPDPVVIGTVNDIEQLTANLSQKIWQKISILESYAPAKTGGPTG